MMKILVTESSGHLGEALMRTLRQSGHDVIGLDRLEGPFTSHPRSITDRIRVKDCMTGVATVFHTATLHKPHVTTHGPQDFIDTNISGTLTLLEAAVSANVTAFVFTSTTSVFGDALVPPPCVSAAWITEDVVAGPEKHLRRHQTCGGGSVPAIPPQPRPCLRGAEDGTILFRAG